MHSKNNRILLTLLFGLSFFLPVHLLWYYYAPAWFPLRSYLNSIPFIVFLLLPAFLSAKIAKPWLILYYCVMIIPTVCSGMHLFFYQTTISPQSFFAIFSTSTEEASEFILSQLSFFSIGYLAILLFLPLYPLIKLLRMKFTFGKPEKYCLGTLLSIMALLCILVGPWHLVRNHQGWLMAKSITEYKKVSRELAEYIESTRGLILQGVSDELKDTPRTIVVVIGESSNRHHWSLYGYFRPTTPKLEALRSELLIFTDAIAPFANTLASVPCALSYVDSAEKRNVPLINAFKQLGFKTAWISNQNTVDSFNPIVQMVSSADEHVYLNKGGNQRYVRTFDESLVTSLTSYLNDSKNQPKRLIFLHMIGSHVNYAARVPDSFRMFSSEKDLVEQPWRNTRAFKYINNYDNTILYTDTVLTNIINELKNIPNSAMIYFSDHGEEVFDTLPQYGHQHHLSSRHYLDIPFLLWLSPSYRHELPKKLVKVFESAQTKPFMNDIAANIIAKLAGIHITSEESDTRNPLSFSFTPFTRMPYGYNYDKLFNGTRGLNAPVTIE